MHAWLGFFSSSPYSAAHPLRWLQEKNDMWAVLAGVLLTGDIEFAGDDSAYVVSGDDVMAKACNQLGIVQDALTEALTCSINIMRGGSAFQKGGRKLCHCLSLLVTACHCLSLLDKQFFVISGEKVERHYKPDEAAGARDAMAKVASCCRMLLCL
jgi:myosin heavy subunit